jgi:hypothetical protein
MLTRLLALVGAAIGWAGLGIQLYIVITGPLGVVAGVWRFIAFFTVLMNMLAACLFTLAVFKPAFTESRAQVQTASAVCMTVVGLVYILFLENLWDPQGLQLIADWLLHYAAPAAAIVFWLICVPKGNLKWSDALRWTGIPVLYLIYVLARAGVDGFYPYFFIDVSQFGWLKVFQNVGGVFIAFVTLSLIFIAVGKTSTRRKIRKAKS